MIDAPRRPPLLAVGLLSAAALAYEVLLTRLFALIQWHHFAFMIISLALLGYGASGTFLFLTRAAEGTGFRRAFGIHASLFGTSAVGAFALAQAIEFNPLELIWDPRQPLRLLAVYTVLAVPFFFAANALGLALIRFPQAVPRVYGADLVGAAAGGFGVLIVLTVLAPENGLVPVAMAGVIAGVLAAGRARKGLALGLVAVVAVVGFAGYRMDLRPSPYKDLSQTLQVQGAHVVAAAHGPLGVVQVVDSAQVPIRVAPGLSLVSEVSPPPQLGLFVDGNGPSPILPRGADLAYLSRLPTALPYELLERPSVLVIGAGGGTDVLQALALGAETVAAVELDPRVVGLVREALADRVEPVYDHPRVRVHVAEARGFLEAQDERFDLIQVTLLDSFAAAGGGLYGLNESYLYTVEALAAMVERLQPGGMLAVTRWLKLPPRDAVKLFATALAALEQRGVEAPGTRLAMIRSWSTTTLLVKRDPFTAVDIERLQAFADRHGFDTVYYPGMSEAQANRWNRLESPVFYRAAMALLGPDREAFLDHYRYDVVPATDDRPYFFNFFRWGTLNEALDARERGGLALLEWGYPIVALTLVQASVLGVILILLPLMVARGRVRQRGWRLFTLAYFGAIGFAFMALEIALIQKFVLYLHHPVYAVTFVLVVLLLGAGLGSLWAMRWVGHPQRAAGTAATGVALLAVALAFGITPSFEAILGQSAPIKALVAGASILPLGFLLGMPFPLGLTLVNRHAPDLVPWAWGINGCASVIGAVGATLLAVHIGYTGVLLIAAALYLGTAILALRPRPLASTGA